MNELINATENKQGLRHPSLPLLEDWTPRDRIDHLVCESAWTMEENHSKT